MLRVTPAFLKAATDATPTDIVDESLDVLRDRAKEQGIPKYHSLPRHELLVLLNSPEARQPILTVVELHKMVREQDGNPHVSNSLEGPSAGVSRKWWSAGECRAYLLKRKDTSELQAFFPSPKRSRPVSRKAILEMLRQDPTAY